MTSEAIAHQREAAFHDEWAAGTPLDEIRVRECFEAPTALENQFILSRMGSVQGKKLLDIGAGLGESSVYFALQGARVTMTDISANMVETAKALGRKYGVELEGIVSSAEELNVPSGEYDIVYAANLIHHVPDRGKLFEQIKRALKPGGIFFAWDPLAYNPAINLYRRMATEVRTVDERPLTVGDLRLARRHFPGLKHREFWIASLLLFVKYYLKDRIHPNQQRYWKRILRENRGSLGWWMPLRSLDEVLARVPGVRWLAWNMVMWGEKEA
ncbi:MAG TPA: class I SAM-dependent methyltransferase [Candidatus Acidoferrum sp.]|nr:class I SAM-dependent methyltransferase [Candidatus Acidoferrum sp.]